MNSWTSFTFQKNDITPKQQELIEEHFKGFVLELSQNWDIDLEILSSGDCLVVDGGTIE